MSTTPLILRTVLSDDHVLNNLADSLREHNGFIVGQMVAESLLSIDAPNAGVYFRNEADLEAAKEYYEKEHTHGASSFDATTYIDNAEGITYWLQARAFGTPEELVAAQTDPMRAVALSIEDDAVVLYATPSFYAVIGERFATTFTG